MFKTYTLKGAIITAIFFLSACNNNEIPAGDQSSRINSIVEQIQKINATIDILKSMDNNLEESLIKQKETLESKINILETYVNQELANNKDWVTATFATLNQYQTLSDYVATLSGDVSNLETSMKAWVNEQLAGYYTMAQIDVKLRALEATVSDGDDTNAAEIEQLAEELATAKSELKTAYENAIVEAISSLNGSIAGLIEENLNKVNSDIATLETRIIELDSRIAALEADMEAVLGMIQSITVIPTYDDGSVDIKKDEPVDILFEIQPLSAANTMKELPKSAFNISAVYTQTKAFVDYIPITITDVSSENNIIRITVVGDMLSEDFFLGRATSSARLYIESGKNARASSFFPLTPRGRIAVDMGLSVKWSNINIGARTPKDGGEFFAWGETAPKQHYSWPTYKWCEGTYDSLTKYCTYEKKGVVDNKTILELEDDVAHVRLGKGWRIPTYEEWKELLNNCTWVFETSTDNHGNTVTGYTVTSTVTGNGIFLPMTGHMDGQELTTSYGEFWSSTLWDYYGQYPEKAYTLRISKNVKDQNPQVRSYGLSIRPVQ